MPKKFVDLCPNLKYIVVVKEFSNRKPRIMAGDIFQAGSISGAAYIFQIWEKKYLGYLRFGGSNSNTVGVDSYSEDCSSLEFDLEWNVKNNFYDALSEAVTLIYEEN